MENAELGYIIILAYIGLGVIAIAMLDVITGRVRRRLLNAADDARDKLLTTGHIVSPKMAVILTVCALVIFWPAAMYGALTKGEHHGEERQGAQKESTGEKSGIEQSDNT